MSELGVGNYICVDIIGMGAGPRMCKIERETPKFWITRSYRFKKEGLVIQSPSKWGPYKGRIPTKEDYEAIKLRNLRQKVDDAFDVNDLSTVQLERIFEILEGDPEL